MSAPEQKPDDIPRLLICPRCHAPMVFKPKTEKCPVCKVKLYFPGENFGSSENAYIWLDNKTKWVHIKDIPIDKWPTNPTQD